MLFAIMLVLTIGVSRSSWCGRPRGSRLRTACGAHPGPRLRSAAAARRDVRRRDGRHPIHRRKSLLPLTR